MGQQLNANLMAGRLEEINMKIKKFITIGIIMGLSLIITTGCLFKAGRVISDDRIIANKRFNNIIKAIKNKDKDGLKEMFSTNALKEANDIDGGIDYIMDFYKGKIISKEVACDSYETRRYGEKTYELKSFYRVTTDKDTYIVFFIDQLADTKNNDNVGLYMLQIIHKSDRKKEFDWGGDKTRCAGIYRPSETEKNVTSIE